MQWLPESYLTMIATTSLPAALVLALAITTTFLIATAITGTRGRRRTHLRLVGASIISFAGTVVLAEALGRAWVFEERSLRIHLFFAHAATTALLAVIATGIARIHRPGFLLKEGLHEFKSYPTAAQFIKGVFTIRSFRVQYNGIW